MSRHFLDEFACGRRAGRFKPFRASALYEREVSSGPMALSAFDDVMAAVSPDLDGVGLEARMERKWPGMDSIAVTRDLVARASARLGRTISGVPRGGASDASHFADTITLTVDGLGPRGGGAHTPGEFVLEPAMRERLEVALALAHSVLET